MSVKHRILPELTAQDVRRFWNKIIMLPSGCWEWQGKRSEYGYGSFHMTENKRERTCLAHRVAYKIYYLIDPLGMCVCHTCDNPPCINPFHLFLGTTADNNRDKWKKGHYHSGAEHYAHTRPELVRRGAEHWSKKHPEKNAGRQRGDLHYSRLHPETVRRGMQHPDAKLTDEVVRRVRKIYEAGGTSYRVLAEQYGISKQTMIAAIKGRTWTHVR